MGKAIAIGLDLPEGVFQAHGADKAGAATCIEARPDANFMVDLSSCILHNYGVYKDGQSPETRESDES